MSTLSTSRSFPELSLLPLFCMSWYTGLVRELCAGVYRAFPLNQEFWHHRSNLTIRHVHSANLAQLARAVRATSTPGFFVGATMSVARARLAAETSGDWNPVHLDPERPHPLFGRLIAHGMDAVIQGLVALRIEMRGLALTPHQMDITFLQPVFLGEDKLYIHITRESDTHWRIAVSARKNRSRVERIVVKMLVYFQAGTAFGDDDWVRSFMALWRISASISEAWPGCLYAKQRFVFHPIVTNDQSLGVVIRGRGKNARGQCEVSTVAQIPDYSVWPSVTGAATIVLAKTT